MKNNELLNKIVNNKKLLFILPHLLYINQLLSKQCINQEIITLKSIFLLMLILFLLTSIIQLILIKIIKNEKYVFYILFFLCLMYLCRFNAFFLIELAVCAVVIFIILNKLKKNIFEPALCMMIFVLITYFCLTMPKSLFLIAKNEIKTKRYKEETVIKVDKELETPNIYWIHADAMMSFDTMEKYFRYKNKVLTKYLEENNFYYNSKASLVAGHQTQKALPALFSPNYYDNHLKKYLNELEDIYLEKRDKTSYNISMSELRDKKINNELLLALDKKDYKTISITKFNNYSGINTDIIYDYYNTTIDNHWHLTKKQELRLMTEKGRKNINTSYLLNQFREILTYSIFSPYIDDMVTYDYENVDYNDLDTSKYPEINKTNYWQIKAIIKALDETKDIKENKFVFIDYDLNHTHLLFNSDGSFISPENYSKVSSYTSHYVYAYKLLIEMINYIKDNDQNGIIIIQSDHGLHTFPNLDEILKLTNEEHQEIRNSVMNAVYIPEKYQNGDEKYLSNPLNISRYLVNNYVGKNYTYLED